MSTTICACFKGRVVNVSSNKHLTVVSCLDLSKQIHCYDNCLGCRSALMLTILSCSHLHVRVVSVV